MTQTPKYNYFGEWKVIIKGGVKKGDGTYYFDSNSAYVSTLTILDSCSKTSAISISDPNTLVSVNINGNVSTKYVTTSTQIDISLFKQTPFFVLDVDSAKLDSNVDVCGQWELSLTAIDDSANALSHVSLTQPTQITLEYDNNWPSGYEKRSVTVEVLAFHTNFPGYTAQKTFLVEEFDCSGRFLQSPASTDPDEVVVLQTLQADKLYTLHVNPDINSFCLQKSMYEFKFTGPDPALFIQTNFNEFKVIQSAGDLDSNEGVYSGEVHRT